MRVPTLHGMIHYCLNLSQDLKSTVIRLEILGRKPMRKLKETLCLCSANRVKYGQSHL